MFKFIRDRPPLGKAPINNTAMTKQSNDNRSVANQQLRF